MKWNRVTSWDCGSDVTWWAVGVAAPWGRGALGARCPGGVVPRGRGAQGAWGPGGVGPWGRGSLGRAAEVLGLWRDTPQIHQTNQVSFQRHNKKGHLFTCNCKNLLAEQYLHDQIDISFSSPDFTCLLTIKHSSESWVNLSPTIKNLFLF